MPYCAACEHRPARCLRRCEREANGAHLWAVIQAEMARVRGVTVMPHLAWERQAGDMRAAFAAGAQAMREMAR